jgi:hypothetical protein
VKLEVIKQFNNMPGFVVGKLFEDADFMSRISVGATDLQCNILPAWVMRVRTLATFDEYQGLRRRIVQGTREPCCCKRSMTKFMQYTIAPRCILARRRYHIAQSNRMKAS